MDKRQQRTHKKKEGIKRIAQELFSLHGVDKVSMDEIAEQANVSKVTIYKYFGSKDELFIQVVDMLLEEILITTEAILDSEMDYLDKLKAILKLQADATALVSFDYLYQRWEEDTQTGKNGEDSLGHRIKLLIYKFFEEGKQKGYIHDHVSFDMLYLYSDIFRAGMQAKLINTEGLLIDREAIDALYDLFFFGILKRQ